MKRRLLSLFICIIMTVTMVAMSSCSSELPPINTEITTTSNNDPLTICIYSIMADYPEGLSGTELELAVAQRQQAILEVEKALNAISIKQYNTTVKLFLFTESEYAKSLYAKNKTAMSAYFSSDNYKFNDNFVINYLDGVVEASNLPSTVIDATLDIFLVYEPEPGSSAYNPSIPKMIDVLHAARSLEPLTSLLNGSYSALKSVSYSQALSYVTRDEYLDTSVERAESFVPSKYIYGVPNNYVIGTYEYLIFNDPIVNQFYPGDKSSFKIASSRTTMLNTLTQEINAARQQGTVNVTDIKANFKTYEEYVEYIKSGKTFAYAILEGSAALGAKFDKEINLDVITIDTNNPVLNYTDATNDKKADALKRYQSFTDFGKSFYCISPSTASVSRALDILLLMNTNVEFANTFYYGVKNTHYAESSGNVVTLTTSYKMLPVSANMFILKPSDLMDEVTKELASNSWEIAKLQNAAMIELFLASPPSNN